MVYAYRISTPANTAETSKQRTVLPLAKGKVHRLYILIPSGHAGLAHLQLNRGLHQVIPISPGEDIAGDDAEIAVDPALEISDLPHQLEAFTWNTDTTYPHAFYLIIGIRERGKKPVSIIKSAQDLIAKMRA